MNEKITEDIVRSHFKADPLFKSIKWEEQKSFNKQVTELLAGASKSKTSEGMGKPEFIVSFPSSNLDYLIVIECKADTAKHRSKTLEQPQDYAVDGVLHYAKALSKSYDVVAVAVSGQTVDELKVSHFVWRNGEKNFTERKSDKALLSVNDYLKMFDNEQFAENLRNIDIIQKAIELNEEYQAYSVSENTRCTMVSAILLALMSEPFRKGYKDQPDSNSIGQSMLVAIESVLKHGKVRGKEEMLGEYRKILNEPLFQQESIKHKDRKSHETSVEVIKNMIDFLDRNVYPLTRMEQSGFDVMGRFYTEFIRYAASEQAQGLVLTPSHITDLFAILSNVTPESVIYDPCCGTGGFLIAAMKSMLQQAGSRSEKRESIKNHQLIGVELRPSMYTYACANMIMRGDGKSNIYCGDCFLLEKEIKKHKPTIAFLNPPYDVGTAGQMRFIKHALDVVAPQNGTVIAIVQMSCGIKNERELITVKQSILDSHRLHAVLSMPDDLFYPVGVVTSVMVFKANEQHEGTETWFGYFKDDGFEKRKHRGRIDARGRWDDILKRWSNAFRGLKEIAGFSVMQEVTAEEEWCAEAYLETDYSGLDHERFEKKIRDLIAFRIRASMVKKVEKPIGAQFSGDKMPLNIREWKWFRYDQIFDIRKGFYNKKPEESGKGIIPFIGATSENNGVTSSHTLEEIEDASKTGDNNNILLVEKMFPKNCITVSNNGSVGFAFYQPRDFTCSHDVNPLYLRGYELNVYIAIFLCTIIELERFRWAYGRKWRPVRMPHSLIKLPVTPEGEPDWQFMENYIKSLPFSGNL